MRFRPPLLGEVVFYTRGLKYNFELIFFWGPGGWLAQSTLQMHMSLAPQFILDFQVVLSTAQSKCQFDGPPTNHSVDTSAVAILVVYENASSALL